jgi:flagellar biosynthesis/type III secretory pathway M-ring protein FliF/YscJ
MMLSQQPAQRPPSSLARGVVPAPSWMIAGVAIAMAVLIVAFFGLRSVYRRRRERQRRLTDSVAPRSSRPPSSRNR